jgi:vacuolar protein sorting-associated protein 13A/C
MPAIPCRSQFFHQVSPSVSQPHIYRKFPKINLKLRAPLELENLLPYNLQYRIYDKDADQNWRSYLRKGGIMPVHSVELGHLVLLNVDVQDTGESTCSHSLLLLAERL